MFNEKQVLQTTLILAIALSIIGVFFRLPIGLGFLLGGLISFLALRLHTIDTSKLLHLAAQGKIDRKQAIRYNWRSFLKRIVLYAAALITALTSPYLSFLATLAGLLLPRLAIMYHLLKGRITHGT